MNLSPLESWALIALIAFNIHGLIKYVLFNEETETEKEKN